MTPLDWVRSFGEHSGGEQRMPAKGFSPDYRHILAAARNQRPSRLPIYEHNIAVSKMEEITGRKFAGLYGGGSGDKVQYFTHYSNFFRDMGYDTVTFEACITEVVQRGECLSGHVPGIIRNRADFEAFDFTAVEDEFWKAFYGDFRALRECMPVGMKGIGGIGNGVFEIVQDFTGYPALCLLRVDDPPLYADLFRAVGDLMHSIWRRFLAEFGDLFAVCRFGDDLGFKSSTLLVPQDIRELVIPQYRRIVDLVHAAGRPFLLHCCGNIFDVMEHIISGARIDAKHSNEDQIAPFPVWVERYGRRIGLFGGVDMNALCTLPESEIRRYTLDVIVKSSAQEGLAVGSGNSIPDYVPAAGYLAMVNAVRAYRGDFRTS
jgi:uroporphyrinogen decarboxylase